MFAHTKNGVWAGMAAAVLVVASGTPTALGRDDTAKNRAKMVEKARAASKPAESRPPQRSSPQPQRSNPQPSRAMPQPERSSRGEDSRRAAPAPQAPAPSGRQALERGQTQRAQPTRVETPRAVQPRVEPRAEVAGPASPARSGDGGGMTREGGRAPVAGPTNSRQRLYEMASQPRSGVPQVQPREVVGDSGGAAPAWTGARVGRSYSTSRESVGTSRERAPAAEAVKPDPLRTGPLLGSANFPAGPGGERSEERSSHVTTASSRALLNELALNNKPEAQGPPGGHGGAGHSGSGEWGGEHGGGPRGRPGGSGWDHAADQPDWRGRDWYNHGERHDDGRSWDHDRRDDWRGRDWDHRDAWHGDAWRGGHGDRDWRPGVFHPLPRHDWRPGWYSRPSWEWGFSFSSDGGFGFSVGYSSAHWHDWRPHRYVYDPCDWYTPRFSLVVSHYSDPYWVTPCCWESCYSPFHSAWCTHSLFTAVVPVYVGTPYMTTPVVASGVGTYVNDGVGASAVVAAPLPAVAPAGVATTYRATTTAGVLDWSATPATMIRTLSVAGGSDRDALVGSYLGRTVAGAWELVYERSEPAGSSTMLMCSPRGVSEGEPPLVALVMEKPPANLAPGRILIASGRVAEITLNDPGAPGGVIVLDDVRLAP